MRLRGYRGEFYVRPVRGYGDWREEEIGRKSARNAMFGGGEERVRGVFREQYVFCGFDFKEDTRVQVSRGDGVVGVFGSHAGVCQGASKGETRGRGFDCVSFSTRFRRHGVESVDFSENDEQFDEFSEETRISRGDYKSSDDETRGQVGAGVRGVIRARGDDESRVIMGRGRN